MPLCLKRIPNQQFKRSSRLELPQITLYANDMLNSPNIGEVTSNEACLRLLTEHNNRVFVFYPFQTRMEGDVRTARVYQFPTDTVFYNIHTDRPSCLTCAETEYYPIPAVAVVVKADVQLRNRRYGLDELQLDLGLGWMF